MSTVKFKLRTTSNDRPGVAVAELWPAFTSDKFQKRRFVIPFGEPGETLEQELEPGNYWVQAALPDGALVQQIINVPVGQDVIDVELERIESPRRGQVQTLGRITGNYPLERRSGSEFKALPSLPGRVDATPSPSRRRSDSTDSALVPYRFNRQRNRAWLGPAWLPWIGDARSIHGPTHLSGKFDYGWPLRLSFRPQKYFSQFLHGASHTPLWLNDDGALQIGRSTTDFLSGEFAQLRFAQNDPPQSRQFVLIPDGAHACLLVSTPDDASNAAGRIRMMAEVDGSPYSIRARVEVVEPRFDSLLQFMSTGDNSAAMSLIEDSMALLYAKFDNPYAAAAAGYVLVQAAPGTLQVPWQEWIGNLGRYFENLPDGDILHATLLLQRGDTEPWATHYPHDFSRYFPRNPDDRIALAIELTLRALGKGPPVFRPGLRLLASNLRILCATPISYQGRGARSAALSRAQKLVTWMSMRVDPREIFTVLRLN